jgi:hypothetical protein
MIDKTHVAYRKGLQLIDSERSSFFPARLPPQAHKLDPADEEFALVDHLRRQTVMQIDK